MKSTLKSLFPGYDILEDNYTLIITTILIFIFSGLHCVSTKFTRTERLKWITLGQNKLSRTINSSLRSTGKRKEGRKE